MSTTATTWARPELAYWPLVVICWAALLILFWVRSGGWRAPGRVLGLGIVAAASAVPAGLLGAEQASRALTLAVVACGVIGFGAVLAQRRTMDKPALIGLVSAVLVIGAWSRAERLSLTWEQHPPLNPDAIEAYESGSRIVHPWQPAFRCGLWYMPVGLMARLAGPDAYNVCWVSYAASIAAMLAIYLVTARWLHPFVGLLAMAGYALNPVAQAMAASGMRADAYVGMTYLVIYFLFVRRQTSWSQFIGLGVVGGTMLLLRQIALVPMLAGWIYGLLTSRSLWPKWLSAFGIWLAFITPFYLSQRFLSPAHDAWHIEHRNVRAFANMGPPHERSDPLRKELLARLERGDEIGPAEFFLRYHSPGQIGRAMLQGLRQIVVGNHFSQYVPTWWVWVVVAGSVGMLWSRHRWFFIYGLFSIFPIQVFLLGQYILTDRLVLHVYPFWLTIGLWAVLRALAVLLSSRHLPALDIQSVDRRL